MDEIKMEEQTLKVRYPETIVKYEFSEYDELQLAHALSIHKSQGSEYRAVVMALHTGKYRMLQSIRTRLGRSLLCTGLTRPRGLCILVGNIQAIVRAVKNDKIDRRCTRLGERHGTRNERRV